MTRTAFRFAIFDTAGGPCGIAWTAAGIARFQLPAKSVAATERALLRRLPDAERGLPTPLVASTIDAVVRYFDGEPIDFSDQPVDLSGQDALFTAIYAATRRIGWGRTSTYGALAREAGAGPEAARDVGQAMATNPVPLIIPCHRVLAAGGKVGGFSAPGGAVSKIRMLALEGIEVGPPVSTQGSLGF